MELFESLYSFRLDISELLSLDIPDPLRLATRTIASHGEFEILVI